MPLFFTLFLETQPAPRYLAPRAMCEEVRVELKRGVRNLYLSRRQARDIYQRCMARHVYRYRL